jgi:hypothetical protein
MSPNDTPTGLLATLRAGVVTRLLPVDPDQDPNPIPVIDGGRADILKSVTEALTKRTAGLCLVVSVSAVDEDEAATNGIEVTVVVQIYERPVINWGDKGRQQSIEDTFEGVFTKLGFDDQGTPGWTPSGIWRRFKFRRYRQVYADTNQVVAEASFTTGTVCKADPNS